MNLLAMRMFLCFCIAITLPALVRAEAFPQLLPDADSFELTVREDPTSTLPLGPSCGGEASLTLACRAFVARLKNVGTRTVHLSKFKCQEPVVTFETTVPNSSNGWWPISQVSRPVCTPWEYGKPGETGGHP